MNTNNQTGTLVNVICRGYEAREGVGGVWGIFRRRQLVCTRRSKEDALKWIEQQADEEDSRGRWD